MHARALADFSGLTVNGTKIAAPQVDDGRNLVIFFNVSDTTINFTYGVGGPNGNGGNCIPVAAGTGFSDDAPPNAAISLNCASAGKAYTLWIN